MSWYLKKSDGIVYGPVDTHTLQLWAKAGRVAPEDLVSEDQRLWQPAPDLPDLAMDWQVELRDRTMYGPIHLMALRELIIEGAVSRRAKLTNKKNGETSTVGVELVPLLIEHNARMESAVEAMNHQLREAEKKARESGTRSGPDTQKLTDQMKKAVDKELQEVRGREEELKKQVSDLKHALEHKNSVHEELEKLKKKYEELRMNLQKGDKEPKGRLASAKADEEKKALQQEVERWKKLYEQQKAATPAPAAKAHTDSGHAGGNGLVPRATLEEAERRFALLDKNYQQLLKTARGRFGSRSTATSPARDNIRRRDVS